MKTRTPLTNLVMFLVVFGVALTAVSSETQTVSSFGQPLSSDLEPTSIASILADPDAWVGQLVRITGEVSGVCTHQGCWMDLTSTDEATLKTLRVKVDDGVIVFPPEAKGHEAIAEGKVEILEMNRDQYEAWLRHVAEEEGREFDPAEVVGDGPYRTVRLRGVGAQVEGLSETGAASAASD